MSRGLRRIGTLQVSADLQCHRETVEDRHEELFEEVQRKDHDHGGEIEPHRQRGQAVTDGTEHRLGGAIQEAHDRVVDRKSTRLNSSHSQISYAVFCLKKKKKKEKEEEHKKQ